jgi:hypothetical protein
MPRSISEAEQRRKGKEIRKGKERKEKREEKQLARSFRSL